MTIISRRTRFQRAFFAASTALALVAGLAHPLSAQTKEESKYQVAQRNLTNAIANLEAYLRDNPNGKDAPAARSELKALANLMPATGKVRPVDFTQAHYIARQYEQEDLQWLVETVDRQSDKTRVTLVITNTNASKERSFYGFSDSPLILIDNKGDFYAMQDVPDVPGNVKKARYSDAKQFKEEWVLQSGRALRITVDFAPLAPGVASGKVIYKENNFATPAKFSLLNAKQKTSGK